MRKIKREQARAGCHCPNRSGLITAPTAPRVYPKARLGRFRLGLGFVG